MIKATVAGADSEAGSELLPLLLAHPDVEVVSAVAPAYAGRRVDTVFPGLSGDTDLVFQQTLSTAGADVLFLCSGNVSFDALRAENPSLKVIDLTGTTCIQASPEAIPALCELYRKPLVRGGVYAVVPDAAAMLTAAALLPLAKNLLLNADLEVQLANIHSTERTERCAARLLQPLQQALPDSIAVRSGRADEHPSRRYALAVASLPCCVDRDHIIQMYHNFFDDHNFVRLVMRKPVPADVANTNKLLLHIENGADGRLRVTAAFDPVVKGGAGSAVHAMNLMFGLHETTGLMLKPSRAL